MKTTIARALTLSLLSLAVLTPFAATRVHADEVDGWYLCGPVQWWWKYVFPNPKELIDGSDIRQQSVVVGEAMRSDRAGYLANRVVYTLVNAGKTAYRGGNAFSLGHTADRLPTEQIARGTLPSLKSGQTFQISAVAYTPEKSMGQDHQIALTVSR